MDDVRLVTHPQAASNWYITLADMMVLLATFFILLISMSTINDVRTKAAVDSVSTTFSGPGVRGRQTPYVASDGEVPGAQEFNKRIGSVLEATIPAVKISTVQTGMLMAAELDTEELFQPDKAEMRPAQRAMLDRLVAAMALPPPGRRVEMEFSVRVAAGADGLLPVVQTLSVARAGAFAREITSRGLPPTALGVGVERGTPGKARLLFRLVQAGGGQD